MKKIKLMSAVLSLALALGIVAHYSASAAAPTPTKVKVYQGAGFSTVFRNGPGADEKGVPVYSFSTVNCNAMFDADGRVVSVYFDSLEVATPNYDGESMPHFPGWPGKEGYNVFDHEQDKVIGIANNTPTTVKGYVEGWQTKRERGDAYHMNPKNEWYKQMNFYQNFFKGKTIAEIEAWFEKNCDANGRPIKATTTKPADLEKLAKLTAAEKAALADVVAGATMSVRDPHGDFLGALAEAFENRQEVEITVK